jgi:hypothetical protein
VTLLEFIEALDPLWRRLACMVGPAKLRIETPAPYTYHLIRGMCSRPKRDHGTLLLALISISKINGNEELQAVRIIDGVT